MFTHVFSLLLIITFYLLKPCDMSCAERSSNSSLNGTPHYTMFDVQSPEQHVYRALNTFHLISSNKKYHYKSSNMPCDHTYFSRSMFPPKLDERFNQLQKEFNERSQDFSITCQMIYKEYRKNTIQYSKKCVDNALSILEENYSTLYTQYIDMSGLNDISSNMFISQIITINKQLQKILSELNSIRRTYEIFFK